MSSSLTIWLAWVSPKANAEKKIWFWVVGHGLGQGDYIGVKANTGFVLQLAITMGD